MSNVIVFENALVNSFNDDRIRWIDITPEDDVNMKIRIKGRDKQHLDELQDEIDKVTNLVGKRVDIVAVPRQWQLGKDSETVYFLVNIKERITNAR